MKYNFTIIVPTRSRYEGLTQLVRSICILAKWPEKLEIIMRIDDDDKDGLHAAADLEIEDLKATLVKIIKPRNEFLSDLWDECYEFAHADRIMACADDCVFRTQDWDVPIVKASPHPDRIVYFMYGNDTIQKNFLATFPIVSRAWIECAGFFIPRGYKRDWCDTHLHDIALRLKKEHRIDPHSLGWYFKDVIFEHQHPAHKKQFKYDATYTDRLKMPCEEKQFKRRAAERSKIATRIARYIKNGRVPEGAKL